MSNKTIIEHNWFFVLSIILLICGVALVWMLMAPVPYATTSSDEIILHENEGIYNVNNQMDILVDEHGEWTLAHIQSDQVDEQFQPALGKSAFGLGAGTYWIRATVTNESPLEQWVIRLNNSVIE